MEGAVYRVDAQWTIEARYFEDETMTFCESDRIHNVLYPHSSVSPLASGSSISERAFYVVSTDETEKSNTIIDVAPVHGEVEVAGVAVLPDSPVQLEG